MRMGLMLVALILSAAPTAAERFGSGCRLFDQVVVSLPGERGDLATAYVEPAEGRRAARPVIRYDAIRVARLSPLARRFFYWHECAHHALGHTRGLLGADNEQRADCWAVQHLAESEGLALDDLPPLQAEIARLAVAGALHVAGRERARRLPFCLGGRHGQFGPWGRDCAGLARLVRQAAGSAPPSPDRLALEVPAACRTTPDGPACALDALDGARHLEMEVRLCFHGRLTPESQAAGFAARLDTPAVRFVVAAGRPATLRIEPADPAGGQEQSR